MSAKTLPRVWVSCLACYNDGKLIGEWFDADDIPTTSEDFTSRVTTPSGHTWESHEEIWVMDHEGWNGLISGECSPVTAAELWETIKDLSEDEREAFGGYAQHVGDDVTVDNFRDAYCGLHDSLRDYAEELYCELYEKLDEHPLFLYVDWDRVARDLECGDYFTVKASDYRGVYVFRSV